MIPLDFNSFEFHNADLDGDGRPVVRNDISEITAANLSGLAAGKTFSLPTGEVRHCLVFDDGSASTANRVAIYDDGWTRRGTIDVAPGVIRDFSVAQADGEMMVTSPDFFSLYGVVGSNLRQAAVVATEDPSYTALDIPMGITVSWQGRMVTAAYQTLWISDAQRPETYTFQWAIALPGTIYGLHVAPNGALIACTTDGVYALPADAAASGQGPAGVVDKVTNTRITGFRKSVVWQGDIYMLSGDSLYSMSGQSRKISTGSQIRALSPHVSVRDLADAQLFAWQEGFIVAISDKLCVVRPGDGFHSWWTDLPGALLGVLEDSSGWPMLVFADGVYSLETESEIVFGGFSGQIPTPPEASPVVRSVTTSSNTDRHQYAALRGEQKSNLTPQGGAYIGSDLWGDATDAEDNAMRSRRHHFANRTDDITLEVQAGCSGSIIGPFDLLLKGWGKRRPTN